VAKQIRRITAANDEHSAAGEALLKSLTEVRGIVERNVRSVADARAVSESLQGLTSRLATGDNHAPAAAAPSRRASRGKNRNSQ
jgi:hypothetical protein